MSEEKSRKDDELPEEEYWQVHVPKPSVVVKKVGQLIERVRTPPRRCVHCGKTVSPDFKICPYCGASIEKPPLVTLKACAYCGAKLSPDFKVCPNCGKPVTETPQAQPSPPTPPLVHTPSILSPAATTPPPTPPAPSIQPSVRGEQQPQYWLDLGNSYYDNREYVKAGECYEKAYQISVTSVFAVPQALAYNAIKEREKRGLKLYRVRPGVVVSLLSVPEIEMGTRGGEMLIIFFNGSQEKSKIKVTPDIPKELEIDEAEFSVELWPGQYTLKSVRVKATDKAKLKEHTVSFNIESTGLKYRAGEAGVELASKAASMVIPFGGALISWLGAKGLESTMTLGIPLKVVETPFWTIFVNFTDKPLEYFDVYNRNWTMSPQALDRMLELSKTYKDIYHVGGGIKKVVSYSGHEITKGDVILLTVVFQDDASAEFRAEKYVFLFGGENKGFRLLASSNLEITRENFDRILDIVLNKPMEVKQCAVIGPLWYK